MVNEFSFGQWIRNRRNILGITCQALAEQVGYSLAMMRKIENDERRPSPQAAALLATALEIPPEHHDAFFRVSRQERSVDQLNAPEIKAAFPWEAPTHPKTNLPFHATLFVGREDELGRLADMIHNPDCNLITLVGLAGIGKTRLAVQAAYAQLDRFPHGVYFVSLSMLDSPELIASAIANAIHFQFHEAEDTRRQLLHYLQEKHMLLVLDNFEHLMHGVLLIADFLQTASGVKLLVTSRERLNLLGEWVFEVDGLPYPPMEQSSSLTEMEEYGAVQLFLQGALRIDPGFRLTEENGEWVAKICHLMQGLPLGIELAAAWVRVLSCKAIASEIEANLDFLKASARDVPERHRSLRAALDHSWNLLSPQEKDAFQSLSVFRGGFRREAAQEVTGASLHEVTSLLDKSLLKRVGDDRFDMHELVRQYASLQLQSNASEFNNTHQRHSSHFASQCQLWDRQYRSPRQKEITAEMETELDNLRSAWAWMVSHEQLADIRKTRHCLLNFYEIRGRFQEGEILFGQAVEALQPPEEPETRLHAEGQLVRGILLAQHAYFCTQLGQYEQASLLLQRSLDLLRSTTDRAALADALVFFTYLQYRKGEYQQARQTALKCMDIDQAQEDPLRIAYCKVMLSYINLAQGDYEQAYVLSKESLVICRDLLGDPHGTADSLITLSRAARQLDRYREAERWAQEGLEISQATNDLWSAGQTLRELGLVRLALGDSANAEALLRQSVSLIKETGDRPLVADSLVDLGIALRKGGTLSESKQCFLEALKTALDTQSIDVALRVFVEMAFSYMESGMPEQALELVTHSLERPIKDRELREHADQVHAQLATRLTVQQIEAAQSRARSNTLESLALAILAGGSP